MNDCDLREGGRLFSAYELSSAYGPRIWVITEADRSATKVLLPEEYWSIPPDKKKAGRQRPGISHPGPSSRPGNAHVMKPHREIRGSFGGTLGSQSCTKEIQEHLTSLVPHHLIG